VIAAARALAGHSGNGKRLQGALEYQHYPLH